LALKVQLGHFETLFPDVLEPVPVVFPSQASPMSTDLFALALGKHRGWQKLSSAH
jgi:hypothetical protein